VENNTDQDQAEIGQQKDHSYKELKRLLLKVSKEFIVAI
jgi:hypothetical protein